MTLTVKVKAAIKCQIELVRNVSLLYDFKTQFQLLKLEVSG